jgi:hypothetical protein
MPNRISVLFQEALHPFRYGGQRLSAVELSSELVPLTYTLSEGDLSADLMRRVCRSEGLGLRGHYEDDNWYDFVGEVNIGINLYYVIEAGRLPYLIERRKRREAALSPLRGRLSGLIARHEPTAAKAEPDSSLTHDGANRSVARTIFGAPAEAGAVRRPRGHSTPHSVESFLGDVNAHTLVPKAVFARYIGRVLMTWLDCGPMERRFPEVLLGTESQAHRSQPVRVADAIAVTADISLSSMEIYNAWADGGGDGNSKEN